MDEKQILMEAWKQTIAVQMHFNEIAMKIRAFALTLIAAILTAESLAKAQGSYWAIVAALISWIAFYLMDRWWYHYLLLGAVVHAGDIEEQAKQLGLSIPDRYYPGTFNSMLGLTQRISKLNEEGWKWKAKYKIDAYYGIILITIIIILILRYRSQ
jgi:hypothetical protein